MEKQKIELKLPANLKFSSLVRHMTEEVFSYIGFTKEWSSRLKLVVDELFMNAVKYGSTEDKSTVHIELLFDETMVEFRIQDDGTGLHKISVDDLKKRIQQNADSNDVTATSGRGLALITSLWTDELKVEEASIGGIAIYFMKKIETTSPPPMQIVESVEGQVEGQVEEQIEEPVVELKGPIITVKLQGEIDQSNLEKMTTPVKEKLDTLPEGAKLVLDFGDVIYINSTVIGHLAEWHNDAEKKKGKLVVINANDQIKDVLDLVGLSRVLNIE
ncbi:anti-sigma factor antagonist [Candidatus Peregrinibacteria bacterium]|nr:anti-sigma factor antagonist [Candidatus Peregrinibacteria bacterium]